MKRIVILVLLIFLGLSSVVQAQEDQNLGFRGMQFSETENPITYKYFQDYVKMLRSKIAFKRYYKFWLMEYRFKLHKDGTITEMEHMPLCAVYYEDKKVAKYIDDIIKNNPPPPYPAGMEIGDVYVELHIALWDEDETNIYYHIKSSDYGVDLIEIFLRGKSLHIIW
ncbi:MAG: hypothetical protein ACI37S_06375 [Candidatus Gastranaerophilaceae bacterium]